MANKKYPCSQPNLYAAATLAWQKCRANQAAFFAFDKKYTLEYINAQIAKLKTAEALPDWNARQEGFSLVSLEYDKVAADLADLAKFFKATIERAFEDKEVLKIMLKTAGFEEYFAKVLKFDDKAILPFMSSALSFLDDKAEILAEKGKMPASFRTEFSAIDALFDDVLTRYNTERVGLKGQTTEKNDATDEVYDAVQAMLSDGAYMSFKSPEMAKEYAFSKFLALVETVKNAGVGGKTFAVGGKKPVSNVTVTEIESGKTTISDKDGRYVLNPLSEGKYTLTFAAEGYVTQTIDVAIKKGVTKQLKVEMVAVAAETPSVK